MTCTVLLFEYATPNYVEICGARISADQSTRLSVIHSLIHTREIRYRENEATGLAPPARPLPLIVAQFRGGQRRACDTRSSPFLDA